MITPWMNMSFFIWNISYISDSFFILIHNTCQNVIKSGQLQSLFYVTCFHTSLEEFKCEWKWDVTWEG